MSIIIIIHKNNWNKYYIYSRYNACTKSCLITTLECNYINIYSMDICPYIHTYLIIA